MSLIEFDFGPEYDIECVKRGQMTEKERIEKERIEKVYRCIHREQLKRSFLKTR